MTGELSQVAMLLGAGFTLGMKHALDADHVAVVSTMVSQTKNLRRSSLLGAWWGVGHTTTLLIAGLVVLLFRISIPARIALGLEFIVGLVVILFGLDLLRKIVRGTIHTHQHRHDGVAHTHLHSHKAQAAHQHRALAIGALHGLAGSAALTLLVLTTVHSTLQGIAFILIFGLGSIVSMFIISSAIGLPLLLTARSGTTKVVIQSLAATSSVVIGLKIVYDLLPVNHSLV